VLFIFGINVNLIPTSAGPAIGSILYNRPKPADSIETNYLDNHKTSDGVGEQLFLIIKH